MATNEIKETKVIEIKALTMSRRILDQIAEVPESKVQAFIEGPHVTELGWINPPELPVYFLFQKDNGQLIRVREVYLFLWKLQIARQTTDNYTSANDIADKWLRETEERLPQIFIGK